MHFSESEPRLTVNTTARILEDRVKRMNLPESFSRYVLYQNEKMMNSLTHQEENLPSMLDRLFQTITNPFMTINRESSGYKSDVQRTKEMILLVYLITTHFKKESEVFSNHSQLQMSTMSEHNVCFPVYFLLLIDEELNRFPILDMIELSSPDLKQFVHPILSLFETSCLSIETFASQKGSTLDRDITLLREELSKKMFSDLTNVYHCEEAMKRVLKLKPRFLHLDDFIQIQMEAKKKLEKDIEDATLGSDQLSLFERVSSQILSSRINRLVFLYSFEDLEKLYKVKIDAAKRNMVSNIIDFLNRFCYEVISEKSDIVEIIEIINMKEYIELRQIRETRSKPINHLLTLHTYLQIIIELPSEFLPQTVLKKSFVWYLCQAFITFASELVTMDMKESYMIHNIADSRLNLQMKAKELIAHISTIAIRYCSHQHVEETWWSLNINQPSSM